MKKQLLILICLAATVFTMAQTPKTSWAKKLGGSYDDLGYSIAADASGNVYTTGIFTDTADFDPGTAKFNLKTSGAEDIFISKVDVTGKFVWAKKIGGTGKDAGYAIALDANGNVYLTGGFTGSVDFDPGTGTKILTSSSPNHTDMDIFVVKFDPSGSLTWAKSIGGTLTDYGSSLAVDANSNVYITGFFYSTVDFDPDATAVVNLSSKGNSDIFILKLDATGKFSWAKSIGSSSADAGRSIALDANSNVYVTGSFTGTADFDPGLTEALLTSAGLTDIFVTKLDGSGNFAWAKKMGGSSDEEGTSITVTSAGITYTTGRFLATADFDPGTAISNLTSLGDKDIFVLKLDASGNFGWVKQFGGLLSDLGLSIALDATGNIYTTGSFKSTVDFDPGSGKSELISIGLEDIFISKLDASGNFVWAKKMGATLSDIGQCIKVDKTTGTIYVIGSFIGTVDFDPDAPLLELTSEGITDIFVHKMGLCPTIDVKTTLTGTNITASQTGATYQWMDCNTNKPIFGETKQTFTAKTNGNYAVIVSIGICADTSVCTKITSIGIEKSYINNKITIHPNPTNGTINLDLGIRNESEITVQILNSVGQMVMEENLIQHSEFDIQHLPKGLYFVKVTGADGFMAIERVVKE